jgi:uncharacterized peroxidase-related enzyme
LAADTPWRDTSGMDETGAMFVEPVPEGAATGALADYYRQQRNAWGFLPNYAAAFSTRPDVAQAWNTLNATVRGGMDRRRFELATIAASRALRSTYCTAAHSKFLRDVCGDEATMLSIAQEPSGAALSSQDHAVYEFAAKVAADAASIEQTDVDHCARLACPTPTSPTSCSPPPPGLSSRACSMRWARSWTFRPPRPSHLTFAKR